jgi:hypothetical protein
MAGQCELGVTGLATSLLEPAPNSNLTSVSAGSVP